ncbi:hypothetical protein GCM10010193_04190 [Kitasatospora atroaurantiaca]|uniref:Uncharacterized protein DUF4237 n=1 Tax=Kitasatospora atroaurantiaca TaxID=285545 RepID=A0A561ELZ0_9ACTN|nr:TNT domain-containing protein [Kitasatospora atroaurantiaca]TWE16637.1 uncharacterized protein DUF4237 [Kitasatospora atroaurantiaca]
MKRKTLSVLAAAVLAVPAIALSVPPASAQAAPPAAVAADAPVADEPEADPNCFDGDCKLGPAKLPTTGKLGELVKDYQRFGGLSSKDFLRTYWDPAAGSRGRWKYPSNNGFKVGEDGRTLLDKKDVEVEVNTALDRFGSEEGAYLALAGTPYAKRAMPPQGLVEPVVYHDYVVKKPFKVYRGTTAPYFNQPGDGTQFQLDHTLLADIPGVPQDDKKILPWLITNHYLDRA